MYFIIIIMIAILLLILILIQLFKIIFIRLENLLLKEKLLFYDCWTLKLLDFCWIIFGNLSDIFYSVFINIIIKN